MRAISSDRQPMIFMASTLSYSERPRATTCPVSSFMSTTSPRANSPATVSTPAGSRLLPPASAFAAPASTIICPLTGRRPASHFLRATNGRAACREGGGRYVEKKVVALEINTKKRELKEQEYKE